MYIKLAQQLPEYGHESFQALVCTCTCMYTYVRTFTTVYMYACVSMLQRSCHLFIIALMVLLFDQVPYMYGTCIAKRIIVIKLLADNYTLG